MWVLAGVGLAVAVDIWLTAVLITVTMVVLLELQFVSDWVYGEGRKRRALTMPKDADQTTGDERERRPISKRSCNPSAAAPTTTNPKTVTLLNLSAVR